jgi:hypothetical protein
MLVSVRPTHIAENKLMGIYPSKCMVDFRQNCARYFAMVVGNCLRAKWEIFFDVLNLAGKLI